MVEVIGGAVLQRSAFGNEAFEIPFPPDPSNPVIITDTSSPGFGGIHPPIFIFTGFPVSAAIASFEREFDKEDADIIYNWHDDRSSARIKVRAPLDPSINGFYVDFGQAPGFNEPFVLRFNWMAVGYRKRYV